MGLNREFPGNLVARTQRCHCWGMGKDEGTKTPQATWCGQKHKQQNRTSNRKTHTHTSQASAAVYSQNIPHSKGTLSEVKSHSFLPPALNKG